MSVRMLELPLPLFTALNSIEGVGGWSLLRDHPRE